MKPYLFAYHWQFACRHGNSVRRFTSRTMRTMEALEGAASPPFICERKMKREARESSPACPRGEFPGSRSRTLDDGRGRQCAATVLLILHFVSIAFRFEHAITHESVRIGGGTSSIRRLGSPDPD